jgi:hypothetical protein
MSTISLLERRIIEARALAPVLRTFSDELGEERVKEILVRVHMAAAREYGRDLARNQGSAAIADLARESENWSVEGALEEEVIEQTEKTFFLNVTRCRYAEEYEKMGLRDWGVALSCCRDIGFIEGFNPKMKLVRTQTVMEGAPYCDFRYCLEG